ncbi:hypothetical protein GRI43_01300 [Altererythrobacter luteolus]|uniref:Transposase n=1 Tax=Pontixanthobacter luteolus TaxID=295089 RepID=A0A6I4UWD2_9SPHN|nr:hypothetical protein [Pontixanthobacter luteolus]MXP46028.1 hypothetical protein [Pontixanthobacter luteolus]
MTYFILRAIPPEDWPWSSAKNHAQGRRTRLDPLADMQALKVVVRNWREMLRQGLEASELAAEGEAVANVIETRLRTGRPFAAAEWIKRQETQTGRRLQPRKRGPKPKVLNAAGN